VMSIECEAGAGDSKRVYDELGRNDCQSGE
jgi:hypothetical protein